MALFAPKRCPVCGNEYKGLGNVCEGGSICSDCYKKIRVLYSEDDIMYMSIDHIAEQIEKFADIIAAQDEKQMPGECPACGRKLHMLNRIETMDGFLCSSCCQKLRDASLHKKENLEPMTTAEMVGLLKNMQSREERAESGSADELRILYPLLHTKTLIAGEDVPHDLWIDPLDELSQGELDHAKNSAQALRAERIEKYGAHRAVFEVDEISKKYTTGKRGIKYYNVFFIRGRTLLGNLSKGDAVYIQRQDRLYNAQVSNASESCGQNKKQQIREGFEGELTFEGPVDFIFPGDILFVD